MQNSGLFLLWWRTQSVHFFKNLSVCALRILNFQCVSCLFHEVLPEDFGTLDLFVPRPWKVPINYTDELILIRNRNSIRSTIGIGHDQKKLLRKLQPTRLVITRRPRALDYRMKHMNLKNLLALRPLIRDHSQGISLCSRNCYQITSEAARTPSPLILIAKPL